MGNCQGKKATVEAVVSPQKGLDVNTTPMIENPAAVTEAATPDPSPSASPTKTVITDNLSGDVEKTGFEAMSEEPTESVMPDVLDNLSGDIEDVAASKSGFESMSEVPTESVSRFGTSDTLSGDTPKSGFESTSRDISTFGGVSEDATEVELDYGRDREANGGFMDKIENFRDSCCAPSNPAANGASNGARGIGSNDDSEDVIDTDPSASEDMIDTNPSASEDMINTAPSVVRDRSTISNASSAALKFTTTSEDEAEENEAKKNQGSSVAIKAARSPSNFSRARSKVSRNRSTSSTVAF